MSDREPAESLACGLCGRTVSKASLERHVRRRHGYVPCPTCGQRIKPENLGHHALRQHGDARLRSACPACHEAVRATDFERHLREVHGAGTLTEVLLARAAKSP